jgi:hypothetical protein
MILESIVEVFERWYRVEPSQPSLSLDSCWEWGAAQRGHTHMTSYIISETDVNFLRVWYRCALQEPVSWTKTLVRS